MSFLLGTISLFALWLLGSFAVGLAGLRRGDATDLPLEIAVGVALLGVTGTLLLVMGVPLSPLFGYILLVAAAVAGLTRGVRPAVALPSWPRDRLSRVLLGAAVVVLLVLLTAALHDRLSWDGWGIWTLKGRILFLDGAFPRDFWTRPGPFALAHADYPLALPLVNWWLFEHAGVASAALASFGGALWFSLLVWTAWCGFSLAGRAGPYAAAAILGLALFWPIWYFAVGGTADVLMALVFLGVAIEVERASATGEQQPLVRASCYLALGALTKNEGLAAALVAGAVITAVAARRGASGSTWKVALAAAVPLALGLSWRMWSAGKGAGVEQLGSSLAPDHLLRSALLVAEGAGRLALYREWPPLVLMLGLGIWRWRSKRLSSQTAVWILLAGYLCIAVGVYLTTTQDLAWLLETSLGRVVSGVVPAGMFLTVAGLSAEGSAGAVKAQRVPRV